MKVTFDLSIEDWMAFQEYYKGKKAPFYKFIMPLLIICAVVIIVLNLIYLQDKEASLMTIISFFLLLTIFYLFFLKKKSKTQLKKVALEIKERNPDAFGPREMVFNENGIDIQATNSHKTLTWEDMDQYEEDKDYYFLFSQKGVVYIIPKRDIHTADFQSVIDQYLPGSKK